MGSSSSSDFIGFKACQSHYYSYMQAERIGLPLTHAVTINFAHTGVEPHLAVAAFRRLRNHHFAKWATRPGRHGGRAFPPTFTYVFENRRGDAVYRTVAPGAPHNIHVHWQLHLPPNRLKDFEQRLREWVALTANGITDEMAVILIKPLPSQPKCYGLKGARPLHVGIYGRGQEASEQGAIIGRRADVSRNLGPTRRRALDTQLGIKRALPQNWPRLHRASARREPQPEGI